MDKIQQVDQQLFLKVNALSGSLFWDKMMILISAHETWVVLFVIWSILIFKTRKWQALKTIFVFLLLIGLTDFISFQFLKPTFGRLRPCYGLTQVQVVEGNCGGEFGFPSNHAANSGATLAFIWWYYNKKRTWVLLLSLLVCFSRVYLGVHYPLDVLGGIIFGYSLCTTLLVVWQKTSKLNTLRYN